MLSSSSGANSYDLIFVSFPIMYRNIGVRFEIFIYDLA